MRFTAFFFFRLTLNEGFPSSSYIFLLCHLCFCDAQLRDDTEMTFDFYLSYSNDLHILFLNLVVSHLYLRSLPLSFCLFCVFFSLIYNFRNSEVLVMISMGFGESIKVVIS